jgi:hypothetical protein
MKTFPVRHDGDKVLKIKQVLYEIPPRLQEGSQHYGPSLDAGFQLSRHKIRVSVINHGRWSVGCTNTRLCTKSRETLILLLCDELFFHQRAWKPTISTKQDNSRERCERAIAAPSQRALWDH